MGHSLENLNWLKVGLIIATLSFGAWAAVVMFNVSLSTLGVLAFLGFFVWMHLGMHGGHGGHDSHGDEHAGHTTESPRDGNAREIAADGNANGPTAERSVKPVVSEEPHRHRGC